MKILIIRHGESEDDLINAYGGWADFHLSPNGKNQVKATAEKLKNLDEKFEILLTSPLFRATETAEIISTTLLVKQEVFEYIKERNTYGILCGMNKEVAQQKYPWLVECYINNEYVEGSERQEDINSRVKKAFELILKMPYQNLILVTHGVFLKHFMKEVLGKKLTKKEDAGFILLDLKTPDNFDVLKSDGIEIE